MPVRYAVGQRIALEAKGAGLTLPMEVEKVKSEGLTLPSDPFIAAKRQWIVAGGSFARECTPGSKEARDVPRERH